MPTIIGFLAWTLLAIAMIALTWTAVSGLWFLTSILNDLRKDFTSK